MRKKRRSVIAGIYEYLLRCSEKIKFDSALVSPILPGKICIPEFLLNDCQINNSLLLIHELIHLIQFHQWNLNNDIPYEIAFSGKINQSSEVIGKIISEGHAEFCSRKRFKYLLQDKRTEIEEGFEEQCRHYGYELFRFIKSRYGPNEALKAGFTISFDNNAVCIDIVNKKRKVKELLAEYKIIDEF